MTRHTQIILYNTLPIAFWLLAGIVSALPFFFDLCALTAQALINYFAPAILMLIAVIIIRHVPRHSSSVEQCMWLGIMTGIAAYWIPEVLLLIFPAWGYLIYRNVFSFRSFLATLIGLAGVAIWIAVFYYSGILKNLPVWGDSGWAWIAVGSLLIPYIASTIARQTLRVR